ncbi:MAG: PAS domain-containing protein [Firmicutes bacterium]|nr:PAS domain-containing protein [Bacillota bacterium]
MTYNFYNYIYQQKEEEIITNIRRVSMFIMRSLLENNLVFVRNHLEVLARINNGQVWLINSEGILVDSYPDDIDTSPVRYFKYREILSGQVVSQRINQQEPMLLIGIPLRFSNDEIKYGLLVLTPVSDIKKVINQIIRLMIFSSTLAVLLSIFVAYNWSRSLSRPLKNISEFAVNLSSSKFGQTIDQQGEIETTEIQNLTKSINQMSLTLEKKINNLTEEKNKLNYVLSGMKEGVLAVNIEKKVILINKSANRLFASKAGELIGKRIEKSIDNKRVIELFNRTFNMEKVYSDEFSMKVSGVQIRLLVRLTPIKIENQLWGVVALFHDITERWHFEQLQREFVSNVSHDLKTPLSSIKGATEALIDDIIDTQEGRKKYLEMIFLETQRLEKLVKEILTLEEMNNDQSIIKLNTNQLLNNVSMIFKNIIDNDNKSIKFITRIPGQTIYIRGNESKLKQVLLNLLDNAYKFSEDGGIVELGCSVEGVKVKFWVKDNGIGISEEELENIWERFYKVDKVRSRSSEGSGLGLSIVKQIVEEQGGSIFADSILGKGSTFGFYLEKY